MTTSLQNLQAACAKCGKPLVISKISERYSYCYKCKSCRGYSAVYLRDGSVRVDPIKTAHVWLTAGTYFSAAGLFGICTVCIFVAAIVAIRGAPFLLVAAIITALLTVPATWLFLWMAILRLRGDPSFGFLHKSIKQSAAFKKLSQFVHDRGERIAVTGAAIACWVTLWFIYRYGGTAYLIGCGTLLGPCTLLLTYFAFGGDIPLKLRQKGVRRLAMIPIAFFLSFLAFFVVVHFLAPNPN